MSLFCYIPFEDGGFSSDSTTDFNFTYSLIVGLPDRFVPFTDPVAQNNIRTVFLKYLFLMQGVQ